MSHITSRTDICYLHNITLCCIPPSKVPLLLLQHPAAFLPSHSWVQNNPLPHMNSVDCAFSYFRHLFTQHVSLWSIPKHLILISLPLPLILSFILHYFSFWHLLSTWHYYCVYSLPPPSSLFSPQENRDCIGSLIFPMSDVELDIRDSPSNSERITNVLKAKDGAEGVWVGQLDFRHPCLNWDTADITKTLITPNL